MNPLAVRRQDGLVALHHDTVMALFEDMRIARHPRHFKGSRSTNPEHLPEHRRELAHRSEGYWQERAMAMGAAVNELVEEVLE
ncbi:MAG: hypothetical protein GY811_00415 [Myxococcales bacterium]|nr:hypothetical protein [Myxococcales bacterium]